MNIQRIDNNVNFQRAIIIKTKKTSILNSLYDYHYFKKENANFKYEHLCNEPDKDGFLRGILINEKELKMNQARVEEKAEIIVISTIDEFRKAKKIIKSMLGI